MCASSRLPIIADVASPGTEGGSLSPGTGAGTCLSPVQPSNGSGQRAAAGVMAQVGFQGNVALVTLGCAKNQVDSEVMLGALRSNGFRSVSDPADADLIVVNTCAFLESAVKEGVDTILRLAEYKNSGRCRRLIVAGCMVERYRSDLIKELPEVDRFISTDEILSVAELSPTSAECVAEARRPYFLYDEAMPRVLSTGGHYSYVKVSEGCDRPCSFCIIPKIRGKFRSRSIESVLAEAKVLLKQGVRELVLVAQDLTAYGSDWSLTKEMGTSYSLASGSQLSRLLMGLDELGAESSSVYWVRLLYAYPIGVTRELVQQIAGSKHICPYLDLPLQHISGSVLKRMRRPLGERRTRELIEMIRREAPGVALRTTFITGFPGETDEDVELLRSFIAEGHFSHVGVFTYSQESEADAYRYPDQVDPEISERRRQILMEQQQQVVQQRLTSKLGTVERVLIEGLHEESDLLLSARTSWQAPETDGQVLINDTEFLMGAPESEADLSSLSGQFCNVEFTEVAGYDLVGRLCR